MQSNCQTEAKIKNNLFHKNIKKPKFDIKKTKPIFFVNERILIYYEKTFIEK